MVRQLTDTDRIAEQIVMTCGIGRTLDVGSGEGLLVASLLRRGVDAYGVDVSEVVTAHCNRRMPGRFTQGSVLELPFEDASFQTVASTDCLEHLAPEDVPKALKEIHRVASRFVFLQIATTPDRDGHWHLTVEGRAWWEAKCFEAGFRKHPAYYKVNSYESLNADGWQITIVLEKIPEHAHKKYPLSALAAERDLHMDMLREVGERSDAHVARYLWAEKYVRQGDRVLDAACGLGYGSYALAELSKASKITGVDGSDYGVDYARENFCSLSPKLDFFAGYLPECLAKYPDGHFDVIVSFETLEHVEHPEALLTEFHRLLSPGGRIVVSVPNDWSDETGEDPNPFHLHVYTLDKLRAQIKQHFIPEALFQQIASGCKTTSAWNSWQRMPRTLRSVPIDTNSPPPSEWWLMVGMKDPVSNSIPYRESVYGYSAPPANLLQFERDYKNPWLVRSLLEFHFRATNSDVLHQVAQRVLAQENASISADKGAALAVLGYQILANDLATSADVEQFIAEIDPYVTAPHKIPHLQRFYVSLAYLKARLLVKIGKFDTALAVLNQVANSDLSIFSPTLGTKVVNAAFEAGLMLAGRGDIVAARDSWKLGVERAYALLSSELEEFVGDINNPHEFPTIVAVEFLDSAVRCIKALRITSDNSFVPLSRLHELTRENWKGMLEERWSAMQSMEALIRERDEAISGQARMLEERWSAMQSMEALIRERDEAISGQARMLEERWSAMQSMEALIRERDEAIGQARMLEERWSAMQSMEALIRERDEAIIEQQKLLEKRPTVTEAMRVLLSAVRASFQHRVGRVLGKK
ncbi:methyltransferase domain-containing protein [Pseudomonas aeruginosa]|uniref:class I SAM-dependent methyltransferase n=1 Tax=Pseudomonas aeruginosa TaxID=287 RepID=UPI000F6425A3|nr:class I SAM-dependent methyltransferase [Pseudomonas aeruginosa]RRK03069.1 methyltransferase domain-containing protein [Pseudomonas aeruginosa]